LARADAHRRARRQRVGRGLADNKPRCLGCVEPHGHPASFVAMRVRRCGCGSATAPQDPSQTLPFWHRRPARRTASLQICRSRRNPGAIVRPWTSSMPNTPGLALAMTANGCPGSNHRRPPFDCSIRGWPAYDLRERKGVAGIGPNGVTGVRPRLLPVRPGPVLSPGSSRP